MSGVIVTVKLFNKLKVDEKSLNVLLGPRGPTKNDNQDNLDNLGRHVQELAIPAVPLSLVGNFHSIRTNPGKQ